MPEPQLIDVLTPANPSATVLVLHGGASRRNAPPVSPTQLSVLRMIPIARRIARAGGERLAVFRVLNTIRGWDLERTPLQDTEWAMRRVVERFGPLPIGLVGHSLGGRTALLAGAEPGVRTIVALNPWVYSSDTADLTGRRVLIVHGDRDRVASGAKSARMTESLRRTTDVDYVTVPGGKHAMLRHHAVYEQLATDFVTSTLLGDEVRDH
ncbi:alpha/beta hydrolase [Antrihabitans cavernicola]|uniref:Alpha/beta hydrolase n=1 Tax=Antrihabitans cavernicola TaxID=2495913 RepID=A0A5A7SGG2_9NOCA|nr:alpha/beta hydrolase [Spelaeibacter cavernicola]KAA0023723.1 alpha/beta hydrolase [Spelaeibacter cavernicola]